MISQISKKLKCPCDYILQDFRAPSTVSPNTIAADRYQFQFLGPNSTTHEINDPDLNVQKGKLRRNFALKEVRFRMDKWINQEGN